MRYQIRTVCKFSCCENPWQCATKSRNTLSFGQLVSDAQTTLVYISQTWGSYYKAQRNNTFDSPVRMFTRQSQLRLHSVKPKFFWIWTIQIVRIFVLAGTTIWNTLEIRLIHTVKLPAAPIFLSISTHRFLLLSAKLSAFSWRNGKKIKLAL